MEKAIIYIRVSTQEQSLNGVSLSDQEERLKAYCQLQGLAVFKVIREEGVSAGKPLSTRPGGLELLQLIKKGEVKHVVVLKVDRLFRNAVDALSVTQKWDADNIALHLLDLGGATINTASAFGRFFFNVLAGLAELERGIISERTTAAMRFKKKHLEVYSPVPFGYDREGDDLKPNPEEQKALKLIKKWRAAGRTLEAIAAELTKKGVKTKRGGKWYAGTIKYILENNLYQEAA